MKEKQTLKLSVMGVFGFAVGWYVANYTWTNKKMQQTFNYIVTLGHLNSDVVSWTLDNLDEVEEDPTKFKDGFIEQVQFVTIAADALDEGE